MTTLQVDSTAYTATSVAWDSPPSGWDHIRLVRNSSGIPRDETDGEILFTDVTSARTNYADAGLTSGRYYYYALFTETSGVWTLVASSATLVTKDFGYTHKMYNRMPAVLRSNDYNTIDQTSVSDEDSFLFRFLSVIGFQLDHIRTETEALRNLRNANLVGQNLLPALGGEVGVVYEPEIGTRSLRHFIANAMHLWSLKGTIPGVRELASVITGYIVHVRIGKNLALDGLDAGPSTDKGRWHGRTNCVVTYRANAVTDTNPAGAGVRIVTATATGTTVSDMNLGDADALLRRQYAIPVLPGLNYTVSEYMRTAGTASTARLLMQWLDANGGALTQVGAAADAVNGAWAQHVSTATAPAGARYLEVSRVTGSLAAGQTVETCGFQVEEGSAATDWQCARKVLVYLDPELINYVGNTSGTSSSNYGWSPGVAAVVDPTLGSYLTKFVPDPEDPNVIALTDQLVVDYPGDALPPPPPPEDSFATTIVWYPSAHEAVAAGDVWTALAEVTPPTDDSPGTVRTARVGFLLYNGATQVGSDYSEEVELVAGAFVPIVHELTVPAGAAYDHIEVALSMEGLCGFRHVALEPATALRAFYFDGSSASSTGDYLWEGTAFQSPSLYYERRASRIVRLRSLLTDYLPHGACFDLVFASTVQPSPQTVSGTDADPTMTLPL